MVVLRPAGLRWIDGVADDPEDLCAHAAVEFSIDGEVLLRPADGDWTVSAAAIYLMRTLSRDHTPAASVARHLFPCCGSPMVAEEGEADVTIVGCDKGKNFRITHEGKGVVVEESPERSFRVTAAAWQRAVYGFADAVESLYARGAPKKFFDPQEAAGFERFVGEWRRRRGRGFQHWR